MSFGLTCCLDGCCHRHLLPWRPLPALPAHLAPPPLLLLHLVQPAVAPRDQQITRVDGLTNGQLDVTIRRSERKRILANFPALLQRANLPANVAGFGKCAVRLGRAWV